MNSDLALVLGAISAALAFPALLGAYSEGRFPRAAVLWIVLAGGLIVYAQASSPQGYAISELPMVFAKVFGQLFN